MSWQKRGDHNDEREERNEGFAGQGNASIKELNIKEAVPDRKEKTLLESVIQPLSAAQETIRGWELWGAW